MYVCMRIIYKYKKVENNSNSFSSISRLITNTNYNAFLILDLLFSKKYEFHFKIRYSLCYLFKIFSNSSSLNHSLFVTIIS